MVEMRTIVGILAVVMVFFSGCTSSQEKIAEQKTEPSSLAAACSVDGDCGEVEEAEMDEYIQIPISELSPKINYYTYAHEESEVRYMAVLGSNGEPRVAFDACEVCWRAGKGYSQDGDSVICNNCGLKFRIDELGESNKGAGCWPAHVESRVEDGNLIIKKSDLAEGAFFFS